MPDSKYKLGPYTTGRYGSTISPYGECGESVPERGVKSNCSGFGLMQSIMLRIKAAAYNCAYHGVIALSRFFELILSSYSNAKSLITVKDDLLKECSLCHTREERIAKFGDPTVVVPHRSSVLSCLRVDGVLPSASLETLTTVFAREWVHDCRIGTHYAVERSNSHYGDTAICELGSAQQWNDFI